MLRIWCVLGMWGIMTRTHCSHRIDDVTTNIKRESRRDINVFLIISQCKRKRGIKNWTKHFRLIFITEMIIRRWFDDWCLIFRVFAANCTSVGSCVRNGQSLFSHENFQFRRNWNDDFGNAWDYRPIYGIPSTMENRASASYLHCTRTGTPLWWCSVILNSSEIHSNSNRQKCGPRMKIVRPSPPINASLTCRL